jgi:hypothetical protein
MRFSLPMSPILQRLSLLTNSQPYFSHITWNILIYLVFPSHLASIGCIEPDIVRQRNFLSFNLWTRIVQTQLFSVPLSFHYVKYTRTWLLTKPPPTHRIAFIIGTYKSRYIHLIQFYKWHCCASGNILHRECEIALSRVRCGRETEFQNILEI